MSLPGLFQPDLGLPSGKRDALHQHTLGYVTVHMHVHVHEHVCVREARREMGGEETERGLMRERIRTKK
jgi:hypothetical protein